MHKGLLLIAASGAVLGGCSQPASHPHAEKAGVNMEMVSPAAPVAAPSVPAAGAATNVAAITTPSMAYAYHFALELPADQTTTLMARHDRACVIAGVATCQVIGSSANRQGRDEVRARLEMRATPAFVTRFRAGLDGEARSAGGRVAEAATESEDLTRQLVDTEARMRALETLRDRLQQLLATRSGTLEQLLQVERELARVQGELDATRSALTVMRTRVQTSRLDIDYLAAGQLAPDSAMRPVQGALESAAYVFMSTLGGLILFLAGALPLLIVFGPLGWLGWRWRRRVKAGRLARKAARTEAETDPAP
ncbi:DUF4349 domain-containing protein [Brevundimonas sp.]|uniref:DUF4349 domain-containing protein n=1 Tax=Brevundimonas sp. TaxID=1871086 RepID=UPI0025BD6762|nr:DUF4349 domain-containing protein [Brevundimonas sp.]